MKRPLALPPLVHKSTYPRNKRLSDIEPTERFTICAPKSLYQYAGTIAPKVSRGCQIALAFHRDNHDTLVRLIAAREALRNLYSVDNYGALLAVCADLKLPEPR